ncbi:hypothetical protein [Clostridium sp.]
MFENAREILEETLKSVIDVNVVSTYSDVSTKTGDIKEKLVKYIKSTKENIVFDLEDKLVKVGGVDDAKVHMV